MANENMPAPPKPLTPYDDSWERMAAAQGMTVDQLFAAWGVNRTAGYNPQPAPQAPATPTPTPTAPAPGMYEGQRFHAGGSGFNVPAGWIYGAEMFAANNLQTRANWMQNDMNDAQKGLANAKANNSDVEIKFFTDRIIQLRQDYQRDVVQKAQTGAGGYHAAQRAATTGMYLSGYEGLKGEVPQGFNIDVPLALVETEGLVPGYSATPTGEGGMPTSKVPEGYEPQYLGETSPNAPKVGDFGTFGEQPVSQIPQTQAGVPGLMQRGGMDMFNPASVANAPAGQLPAEEAPSVSGGQYPTENFRGFRNWNQMQSVMGDDANRFFGGTGTQLRQYLGNPETRVGGFGSSSGMRQIQRVDLGQGEQDYYVRRDGMGNIRSFSPVGSHVVNPSSVSQWRGKPYMYDEY